MGIPLNQTPIASFFESIFKLQLNISDNQYYYHKDVLEILNHPLSGRLFEPSSIESISQSITSNNLIHLKFSSIVKKLSPEQNIMAVALFTPWTSNNNFCVQDVNKIITYLIETTNNKVDALLIEYLLAYRKVYNLLEKLSSAYTYIKDLKTLYRLFLSLIHI